MRHGETDLNKNGRVQGRGVDSSLNEAGRIQSNLVSNHFSSIPFNRFYSSSLIRTRETLSPLSTSAIALEGFDEISWGDQEGAEPTPEAKKMYADTINDWRNGKLDRSIGGGESPLEVMKRQKPAIEQVLNNDDGQILICMHGRALRILLCWLLNYPLNFMDGFPHQNCSYYSLDYNGSSFSLKEFNVTHHLNNG